MAVCGAYIFFEFLKKSVNRRISDIEKIPSLENRVIYLEQQSLSHNDTKDAVIRMEEQIRLLTDQVRRLTDLLMRKDFNNG